MNCGHGTASIIRWLFWTLTKSSADPPTRVLEIGFGNGDSLVHEASENPGIDYLGVEVHEPGIGHCLVDAHEAKLTNLRIIRHDAIEVLQHQIGDGAPDPHQPVLPGPLAQEATPQAP